MDLKALKSYKRDALLGALGAFLMLVGDLCLSMIPESTGISLSACWGRYRGMRRKRPGYRR